MTIAKQITMPEWQNKTTDVEATQTAFSSCELSSVENVGTAGAVAVNRRVIMNMLVSSAIAGNSVNIGLAAEASAKSIADARLQELAKLIPEAVAVDKALDAEYAAASIKYNTMAPQRPDRLRWRPTDPVWIGYDMEKLPNNKCRLWCSEIDIRHARREGTKLVSYYQYIGPNGGDENIKDDDFDDSQRPYAPKPHIAHLYEPRVRDEDIKRSAEITAAYDEYKAARAALKAELGIDRLLKLSDDSADKLYSLYREATEIQTTSLEGLQAKAEMLLAYEWRNGIDSDELEVDDMLRSIVTGLLKRSDIPRPSMISAAADAVPDPIFNRIGAHKVANAEYDQALKVIVPGTVDPDPDKEKEFGERERDARWDLTTTVPTTLLGALTVLNYVENVSNGKYSSNGNPDAAFGKDNLMNIIVSTGDCLRNYLGA